MNTESFCSYEVSNLLREKGFDVPAEWPFINKDNNITSAGSFEHLDHYDEYIPTYTHQRAMAWLREEHDIDIIPVIRHSLKYAQESPFRDYACRVYDSDGNIVMSATKWYSRYERAVEAALEYVLTKLI